MKGKLYKFIIKYAANWLLSLFIVSLGLFVVHIVLKNLNTVTPYQPVYVEAKSFEKNQLFNDKVITEISPPVKNNKIDVTANIYHIYEANDYEIKAKHNINEKQPIASLTKLMTALVVFENYDLDEYIVINKTPSSSERNLGLKKNAKINVEDGLKAMLISSYNDVPIAFADAFDGGYKEFIKKMNEKAEELGMENSNFSNPSGLEDHNNYSTARDLQKLVDLFLQNKELVDIVRLEKAEISYINSYGNKISTTVRSTNRLLDYKGNVGIKTGYTGRAGECFIGDFRLEEREYIVIVLDSQQRFTDTRLIMKALSEL